jgi:CRISPR/Cas system endoribonuclease Cas6 (RAMP superfamily)
MPLSRGRLAAGQPVALRVTFADDDRARQFCEALATTPIPRLGASPCCLVRLPHWHSSDPDCLYASWAQLADAPPARRLHICFETPTFFSHQGEMRLLPEPIRLWEGWRRTWEALAPALPLGTDALTLGGMQITRYQLRTEAVALKGGLYRGFIGEMVLEWRASTPPETRRTAAALAGIADFFGTGAKTMLGLGQTRVTVEE